MQMHEYSGEARSHLDNTAELIGKLRNRALEILDKIPSLPIITEDTNCIVLLYRDSIAHIDAFEQLSRLPSVEGMKVVLRTFFESKCLIEFILESETERRSIAYQTNYLMKRIRMYAQFDDSTEHGKQTQAELRKDRLFGGASVLHGMDTSDAIANLGQQLDREPYRSLEKELSRPEIKHWYSIDNGPKSFQDLCRRLSYPAAYELLYRRWSGTTHSETAYVDSFFADPDINEGRVLGLRAIKGYQAVVDFAFPLMCDYLSRVTEKLMPNEYRRFARFYKNVLKPFRELHVANVTFEEPG